MSDYLLLLETGDKVLQENNDFIGLDGIGYFSLTKSNKYTVTTSVAPTKSLQYVLVSLPPILGIITQLKYKIIAPVVISQSCTYKVANDYYLLLETGDKVLQENNDRILLDYVNQSNPTKSTKYCVLIAGGLLPRTVYSAHPTYGSHVLYGELAQNRPDKSIRYTIYSSNIVTKSLNYRIFATSVTLSFGMTYALTISNKSLKYTVKTTISSNKSNRYAVANTHLLSKSMQYAIPKWIKQIRPTAIWTKDTKATTSWSKAQKATALWIKIEKPS